MDSIAVGRLRPLLALSMRLDVGRARAEPSTVKGNLSVKVGREKKGVLASGLVLSRPRARPSWRRERPMESRPRQPNCYRACSTLLLSWHAGPEASGGGEDLRTSRSRPGQLANQPRQPASALLVRFLSMYLSSFLARAARAQSGESVAVCVWRALRVIQTDIAQPRRARPSLHHHSRPLSSVASP